MQTVTLWLGEFKSSEALQEYLRIEYTEDGDSIDSNFEKDFQLGFYNRDLVESDWIEIKEKSLPILLDGFSYDEQIKEQFIQSGKEYNAIVLIYDYSYNEKIRVKETDEFFLELIGTAQYKF